jgi:hypothetical protein
VSTRAAPTLNRRQLNRATLERQMLLSRAKRPVVAAVEQLVALQAQQARPPFVGLWSRLRDFRREQLLSLIHDRKIVRATTMRCTLHLMSARDFLLFRGTLQPALSVALGSVARKPAAEFPMDRLLACAKSFFDGEPRTFEQLRDALTTQFPSHDPRLLSYAVRTHLPLVQAPRADHGWGYHAAAEFTAADAWLGQPIENASVPEQLVLRYLAAFGPATAADVQTWSGLRGLAALLEGLRPQLREFQDEQGRRLFDLPRGPRPSEDAPAPVRFIPEYDNLVLGHADRTRVISDDYRKRIFKANLRILPTLLVDGFVAGTWSIKRTARAATLTIEPFENTNAAARDEAAEEGGKLLGFVEPDAERFDVKFAKPAAK